MAADHGCRSWRWASRTLGRCARSCAWRPLLAKRGPGLAVWVPQAVLAPARNGPGQRDDAAKLDVELVADAPPSALGAVRVAPTGGVAAGHLRPGNDRAEVDERRPGMQGAVLGRMMSAATSGRRIHAACGREQRDLEHHLSRQLASRYRRDLLALGRSARESGQARRLAWPASATRQCSLPPVVPRRAACLGIFSACGGGAMSLICRRPAGRQRSGTGRGLGSFRATPGLSRPICGPALDDPSTVPPFACPASCSLPVRFRMY
jgi:hypothetical protein